jgi:hypothetical protein
VSVEVGDGITVDADKVSQMPRHGVIEEVLREAPPRFRVHWDDGHESILSPPAGSMHIEPKRRASAAAKRTSRKTKR